jgi:predicted TPR repeat methyltransferase
MTVEERALVLIEKWEAGTYSGGAVQKRAALQSAIVEALREQYQWLSIETYDKLAVKPKLAAFYFRATEPTRPRGAYLHALVELTRHYGSRVCTHWHPLADTGTLDKAV